MTCDNNGNCTYGANTTLRTSSNVATSTFSVVYDLFEDDGGGRCNFDGGDDCRANSFFNIPFVVNYFPSALNSFGNSTSNLVYNAGSSTHTIRLANSWRYSGTANLITPTCAVQSTAYSAGGIVSWSVNLTAGVLYNFNNCTSASNDTYMRIYGSDGYTINAIGDDNCGALSSINFTPTTTGTYYIEISQYTRGALLLPGTLYYSIVTPTLGTLSTAGPIDFCDAGGNFVTAVSVSSATNGSVMWDWGSNNGVWNNNWIAGNNSGVCCFPKKVSNSDGNADRIRYRVVNGSCSVTSSTILIQNRYNEAPTNLVTTPTSFCEGSIPVTISLTANFPSSINMHGVVGFYSGSCGGTLLGTVAAGANSSAVSITIPAPSSTTTYFARYEPGSGSGCSNSACVQTTVTINTLSTAPTIATVSGTVCPNVNTTLTASGGVAGSGSNIVWYTGPNGSGSFLGTGSSIVVAPTSTTTYYARREGTCNNTTDASVIVNVKSYIYATNGATTSNYCTDNSGWNHFYVGNDIILSVQGDLSGAGVVTATIYDNGTYYQNTTNPALCSSNVNPGEQSFEMARSWNLDLNGGTPNGTYNVRFYHTVAEKAAVENAAINWMATYPACSYSYKYANPLGFYWFKNTGANYTAPDYDGLHLTGSSGTTSNGVNYAQLTGITSFSGGSGAVTLVPLDVLPVTLSSLNAICAEDKKSARIEWTTATEQNSSYFVVERSTDAVNWNAIATLEAAGNSVSTLNYSFVDNDIRQYDLVYYRLKEYDLDAAMMQSGIVSLNCVETTAGFDVYPNPANAQLNVLINRNM
jgi:hypothetical protein